MALRRISDLSELYLNYPDASISSCLLEVSYNPIDQRYQSFYVHANNLLDKYMRDSGFVQKDELSNYVTLDKNQTITGIKTFSKGFKVGSVSVPGIVTLSVSIGTQNLSSYLPTNKAIYDYIDAQGYISEVDDKWTERINKIDGLLNDKNFYIAVHPNSDLTYASNNWKLTLDSSETHFGVSKKDDVNGNWCAVKDISDAIAIAQTIKFMKNANCYIYLLSDYTLPTTSTNTIATLTFSHPDLVQNKYFDVRGWALSNNDNYMNFTYNDLNGGKFAYRKIQTKSKVNDPAFLNNSYYTVAIRCYSRATFRYINFDGKLVDADFYSSDYVSNTQLTDWRLQQAYSQYFLRNEGSDVITINKCSFTGFDIACIGPHFDLNRVAFCRCNAACYCTGGTRWNIQNSVNVLKCRYFIQSDLGGTASFGTIAPQYTRIQTFLEPFSGNIGTTTQIGLTQNPGYDGYAVDANWACEIQKLSSINKSTGAAGYETIKISQDDDTAQANYVQALIGAGATAISRGEHGKTTDVTYINNTNSVLKRFNAINRDWLNALTQKSALLTFTDEVSKQSIRYPDNKVAQCPPNENEINAAHS